MFNKLGQFKDSVKALKELEEKLKEVDLSNPKNFIDNLDLDISELENKFDTSFDIKNELTFENMSDLKDPEYAYPTDSGFDLRSVGEHTIPPFGRELVPTGLKFNIPDKCEIQVRPKSGLALKRGLSVLNTPGTVDNGYTGEVKVIVINLSNETQVINKGDKIAQAVVCPVLSGNEVSLIKTEKINDKERKDNGFGSTGN